MKLIKNILKDWNIARIIRIVLAGALFIAYYYNRESLFLFVGVILTVQAVLNLSCPGGSCGTSIKSAEKPSMEFKKYEPKK